MADKKISEMATASVVDSDDNIELSHSVNGGFTSVKASILAIATKILTGINFASALETTDKTVIGAINEAAQGGGGSSSLAGLSDVDIDDQTLDDDQVLVWDSVNEKWVNADQSGQGGTTVVANPSGEATDDLLKVQIGSTIYDIPGGSISALSGKSLVMKTKTWTGDGNNPCVLTFTEKPYAIFNIFGDGLNGEKVLNSPFIYGETSYYLSSYSNGILFNSVSYSNNDLTMTMSGIDEGAVFNVNGSQYTMWYLVEETFNEFKDITGTLEAGETSITLSDADITSDSTVQPFTDVFGLNPTNMVVANGSVTLTFDAQQSDVRVKVRISSNCAVPVTNLSADDIPYDSNNSVKDMIDEVATDSGWITLNQNHNVKYRKVGKQVQVVANTQISEYTIFGTLSQEFRPTENMLVYNAFTDINNGQSAILIVRANGSVEATNIKGTGSNYFSATLTYFVG